MMLKLYVVATFRHVCEIICNHGRLWMVLFKNYVIRVFFLSYFNKCKINFGKCYQIWSFEKVSVCGSQEKVVMRKQLIIIQDVRYLQNLKEFERIYSIKNHFNSHVRQLLVFMYNDQGAFPPPSYEPKTRSNTTDQIYGTLLCGRLKYN